VDAVDIEVRGLPVLAAHDSMGFKDSDLLLFAPTLFYNGIAPQAITVGPVPVSTQRLSEEKGSHASGSFFCRHLEPFLDGGIVLQHAGVQRETRIGNCPETWHIDPWESLRK
jgi:hypothetical protein